MARLWAKPATGGVPRVCAVHNSHWRTGFHAARHDSLQLRVGPKLSGETKNRARPVSKCQSRLRGTTREDAPLAVGRAFVARAPRRSKRAPEPGGHIWSWLGVGAHARRLQARQQRAFSRMLLRHITTRTPSRQRARIARAFHAAPAPRRLVGGAREGGEARG